jgi:hypothetical protein
MANDPQEVVCMIVRSLQPVIIIQAGDALL